MQDVTLAFLKAMEARNATGSAYCREEEIALLTSIGAGIKEAFDLQLMYDDVELVEEDQILMRTLGEYRSKLGGFRRVAEEVRGKVQELARIRREIDELEARVGQPALEKAEASSSSDPADSDPKKSKSTPTATPEA